jgi:hypothetical protein
MNVWYQYDIILIGITPRCVRVRVRVRMRVCVRVAGEHQDSETSLATKKNSFDETYGHELAL